MSKGAAGWGVSITRGPFLRGADLAQTLRLTPPAAMADTLPDEHEQLLTILCCLSAKSWGRVKLTHIVRTVSLSIGVVSLTDEGKPVCHWSQSTMVCPSYRVPLIR